MKTIFKKNTSQTVPRATVKAHASFQGQKVVASLTVAALVSGSARALTFDETQSLTYLQVKGSGLANTCPVLDEGSSNLKDLPAGNYKFENFCMEPTSFKVKDRQGGENYYVDTKLMTRLTYTLDAMSGKMTIGGDGKVSFAEEDGVDYAPTTIQLPG